MADKKESLSKESKITILSLLKNFYDSEVFFSLMREIYNSDLSISLTAISASSSLGNEIAIQHLYKIIENGKPEQIIAGIKALADIGAPSSLNRLLEYYNFFRKSEIQLEILRALNSIDPKHKKIIQLNEQVVQNPQIGDPLKICAAKALVDSEQFRFLQINLTGSSQTVKEAVFLKVLESESDNISAFLWYFRKATDDFSSSTLGCYLAAYQAVAKQPQQSFVIEKLKKSEWRTVISFLLAVEKFGTRISQPIQIFRTMLIIPYMNKKIEAVIGSSLEKIILNTKETSGFLLNEMAMMTRTHLDTIMAKVRRNYRPHINTGEKEELLMKIFAHLLENYGNQKIIDKVKQYFKTNYNDNHTMSKVIASIEKQFVEAGQEEQKILKACFPLFQLKEMKSRLKILSYLKDINLHRPFLLRRLNRLIRVAGLLAIRSSVKKILEVLDFARKERISFLEETCIVALCQLLHRGTIEQADKYFRYPDTPSFRGYIRGAGYMPPSYIISSLLDLLARPILDLIHREIIVSSIEKMNHDKLKHFLNRMLSVISMPQVPAPLKERIGNLIVSNPSSSLFQPLLDLTYHKDGCLQCIAIQAIKGITNTEEKIPQDLLVNRLYILLDEGNNTLKKEVLLTLISLKDDYAVQVLNDYLTDNDEQMVADIIEQLEVPLSHDIIKLLLSLVGKKSKIVQIALRKALSKLISGDYAEEIRNSLLEYLKSGMDTQKPKVKKAVVKEENKLLGHAKKEYKFKRENNQLVTVLFIDIVGYTEKSSDTDSVSLMNLIRTFEQIVIPIIKNYKGIVIKKMGDGILAIFKNPLNASFAALAIQNQIKEKNTFTVEKEKFEVRIGLNTGEVIRKEGDVYGDVVNIASRMETAANPGDILLTQSTYNEIKEYIKCTRLGNIIVKGKTEAITAYVAEKVFTDTRLILDKSKKRLYKYTENNIKNPLTVLKESTFTPDFSLPLSLKASKHILKKVRIILSEITKLGEDLTHDYYDEYMFKQYVQEKWDELLDTLVAEEKEQDLKAE